MNAKQVIVLLLQEYCGASLGMISVIILHCLIFIKQVPFVPSSFNPARGYKILCVSIIKRVSCHIYLKLYTEGQMGKLPHARETLEIYQPLNKPKQNQLCTRRIKPLP